MSYTIMIQKNIIATKLFTYSVLMEKILSHAGEYIKRQAVSYYL